MQRIVIVLVAIALVGVGWYAGTMSRGGSSESVDKPSESTTDQGERTSEFDFDYTKQLFARLNPQQRQATLSNPRLFKQIIDEERLRLALLDAAVSDKLDQDENIKFLIKRKSDDVLLQNYVNKRVMLAGGIPKEFPSGQQISDFYQKNKAMFTVPERVPVWQIFWEISSSTSQVDRAKIEKQASSLSWQLKKGKKNFRESAQKVSQHAASRLNGGFMGILKVSELRPTIKDKLLSLKIDEISAPIRSEQGLHIFRRGEVFPQTLLPLSQARGQVVQRLRKALNQKQRHRLNQLAVQKYPVKIMDSELEKWRAQLSKEMIPANDP